MRRKDTFSRKAIIDRRQHHEIAFGYHRLSEDKAADERATGQTYDAQAMMRQAQVLAKANEGKNLNGFDLLKLQQANEAQARAIDGVTDVSTETEEDNKRSLYDRLFDPQYVPELMQPGADYNIADLWKTPTETQTAASNELQQAAAQRNIEFEQAAEQRRIEAEQATAQVPHLMSDAELAKSIDGSTNAAYDSGDNTNEGGLVSERNSERESRILAENANGNTQAINETTGTSVGNGLQFGGQNSAGTVRTGRTANEFISESRQYGRKIVNSGGKTYVSYKPLSQSELLEVGQNTIFAQNVNSAKSRGINIALSNGPIANYKNGVETTAHGFSARNGSIYIDVTAQNRNELLEHEVFYSRLKENNQHAINALNVFASQFDKNNYSANDFLNTIKANANANSDNNAYTEIAATFAGAYYDNNQDYNQLLAMTTNPQEFAKYIDGDGSTNAEVLNNGAIKAGVATTIKNPYKGVTPQSAENAVYGTSVINESDVNAANNAMDYARNNTERGFKATLKSLYKNAYDKVLGGKTVTMDNVSFDGEPYDVTLNSNIVEKVISDKNISAEKLAVFGILDNVVKNGQYVGSGQFDNKGNVARSGIRYDYFETKAELSGKPYTIAFDVEVLKNQNNYRTHRVINNMSLTPLSVANTGPAPAAADNISSSSSNSIAQNQNNATDLAEYVNSPFLEDAVNTQEQATIMAHIIKFRQGKEE